MPKAKRRPLVAIGLLGPTLDAGGGEKRWQRWRPTLGLHMQDDLLIDRFVMLHQRRFDSLAERIAADIGAVSPHTSVCSEHIEFDDPWDFAGVYAALWGFARSQEWRPEEEDYLVHITTGTHVAQICLFLLAESRHLPGRLVQTQPARGGDPDRGRDRARNTAGSHSIIDLDLSRYDQLASRFAEERVEAATLLGQGVPSQDAPMRALVERINQVAAATRAPILLGGPTGSGKTALARRIYQLKKQRHRLDGPLVELNCATVRGDAAASMLFGHSKGAFTGALAAREGLLRRADGGLLFLDEIGELGLDEQAMLLRAIEDQVFIPLGSDTPVQSDFQLVAGSNRNLRELVASGQFREDLLARIDLWTFTLPGLAQRRADIGPNIDIELERFAREEGRQVRFNAEAQAAYLAFATSSEASWRGNFRDLSGSITRLATLASQAGQGRIDLPLVLAEIAHLRERWQDHEGLRSNDGLSDQQVLNEALGSQAAGLDHFDAVQLAAVLRCCRRHHSLSAAGRELFAVSRLARKHANDADRLQKYLARFGLSFAEVSATSGDPMVGN